jgi:hypothetical protein
LPISSPQLTAAAGTYAYANLLFWEGQTSPWHLADVIIASFFHVDLPLFTFSSWGHWRLWARLLNFYSSLLESPMDVIFSPTPGLPQRGHPLLHAAGLLPLLAASTHTACLYANGLPLRLRPASTPTVCFSYQLHPITIIIVIVIVHFLFKRNFYLSPYVIYILSFFILEIIFLFLFQVCS